jgi:peptidoglycan/xylan/chitin deacetylase (PgdA/CDA1 family)
MKRISPVIILLFIFIFGCKNSTSLKSEQPVERTKKSVEGKPSVSFTFDDGITSDLAGFEFEEWNKMILSHLKNEKLKAVFFVTGKNKLDAKGQFLLQSWNDSGHKIANHTFSHSNFNSVKNTSNFFEMELKRTDSIISKFSNHIKLFRFPYLKEGKSPLKVDSIRNILIENHYLNGYVTIDASDWYVNKRLIERIKEVGLEKTDIEGFKNFYVAHIMERAKYYEKLSYELNGRHINHTLLLHHNLVSALFLDDLIKEFKEAGWETMNAKNAYDDAIFNNPPNAKFAGESLIWSLAKQSGKYDQLLRYPAEDSRYEKLKMDNLGL